MLAGADGLEPNEGHLHAGKSADSVPRGVGDVETVGVSPHQDEGERVKRYHVGNKGVSTCKGCQ